jgi:hypothetical protein
MNVMTTLNATTTQAVMNANVELVTEVTIPDMELLASHVSILTNVMIDHTTVITLPTASTMTAPSTAPVTMASPVAVLTAKI